LAYEEKIAFYDAVYLTLAKDLHATLITADANLRDQIGERNKSSVLLLKECGKVTSQHVAKEDSKLSKMRG
jgi:uncharacterized protein YacL